MAESSIEVTPDALSIQEPHESHDESVNADSGKLPVGVAICEGSLFILIAMILAIIVVCLTSPKPRYSCESSFKSVITMNSTQRDSNPQSLIANDLNYDTFVDIVVVNSGTNNIGIFLNDGHGNFALQMTIETGDNSRPVSAVLADFNNDTYLDIAVANYDTHNIGIILGYGNGSFAKQITSFTGASRPVSIAVGDLNHDHWLDLVVTNNGTDIISIYFGYGNGYFQNSISYSTGYDSFPYFVDVHDFNSDQNLDIVVANYGSNNIGIFNGYGNGTFHEQITYSTGRDSRPASIAVHDFNNDKKLDIVVANSGTNNIGIFLSDGNGSFLLQKTFSISPGFRPQSIAAGDFDQDNRLDIAVSNYVTNNISILIGYGNGSFETPTLHSTGSDSGPLGMIVDDFDNNNQSDIAVVNFRTNNVLILLGYSLIHAEYPTVYSTGDGALPYQVHVGDFNNDTEFDLVVLNSGLSNVAVFLGIGNGSFRERQTYSVGSNSRPAILAVIDIDKDFRLDLVVANSYTESVGILYGFGNGSFDTLVSLFIGKLSVPHGLAINDFNNDNYLDIVYCDYSANTIGIFLGHGNRTFGDPMTYPSGENSHPYDMAAADFNNDGKLDVVVAAYGTNNIGVFLGFGNGTFQLLSEYSTGDSSLPWMLTVADLNKDNNTDILTANSGSYEIGIFYGYGNSSFRSQLSYSTGFNSVPDWVSVADYNNDGWVDLAVALSNVNNIGVFLGDSRGYFGNQTIYPTGPGSAPDSLAVADFNKDNLIDVAATNYGTNNLAILLNRPRKVSENQIVIASNINRSISTDANMVSNNIPILLGDYYVSFLSMKTYSTGSSSRPYSIAIGDLNNDKIMDIAVANSGHGNIGLLTGLGDGTFATETFYSIGSDSNPKNVITDDFNNDNYLDIAVNNAQDDSIKVLLGDSNGTFSTEITYSTGSGSNPSFLTIGNFNNDEYLDLVVANKGTDTIGVFFGYDYTAFARQNSIKSVDNSIPLGISIADFNKDGHMDIACTLFGVDNVAVSLGYGNGSFAPIMTYSNVPSSHPTWVAVGDFNRDGQVDMTIANSGIDNIAVVFGYGNGSFSDPVLYALGSGSAPLGVSVGDFNNDTCLDIVTVDAGGSNLLVFLGYGNGSFQNMMKFSSGVGSRPGSVAVSDLNHDARLDVIVANTGGNNVGIFLGYGNGSFAQQITFSTGAGSTPWYAIPGDFNRDSHLDIAIANYGASNVGILYGYGNGTFGNFQTYSTGLNSKPANINIGDFNKDNQLDIIVADETNGNVGILFGYSDGTFASISFIPTGQASVSYFVAVGDLNNDSRLDFTMGDTGNSIIQLFLSHSSKPFGGQTTFYTGEGSNPSAVAVGHFNNDNHLDMAITNYGTNSIGILLGDGNRMFLNSTTYSTGSDSHPVSLSIGKFNDDSYNDIVVANSETNNIMIFIGSSNGSFSFLKSYSMSDSSHPVSVSVGNFNRDNYLDITVANFGTNNLCVLFGCGNGSFTNQTWYPMGYNSRPNWVIFKDVNNDNWEDIAVATYGIDNVKILLNLC